MSTNLTTRRLPNGPAAAAVLASAIGVFVLGLMTTGAVLSAGLNSFLNWYNPAGPLTGKTGVAVLAWLISWAVLHNRWKDKDVALQRVFIWTIILIVLALALTFPPIFEAFE